MDTLEAMAMFVRVVERGSFSAVARELGTTQPTVSKQINALEKRLGGRLIARSTRQLSLTDQGSRYYKQCRDILAAVDSAEHSFQTGREAVAGPLRIASSVSFGRLHIAPRLQGFLERYPEVTVDLLLSDQNVDLVSEGMDVAIRIGELKDSSLIARQIGLTRCLLVAAPDYLERHGTPQTAEELSLHNCILFNLLADFDTWVFDAGQYHVQVKGNVRSNNSEAIRQMVQRFGDFAGAIVVVSPGHRPRPGRAIAADPDTLSLAHPRPPPGQPQAIGAGAGVRGLSGRGVQRRRRPLDLTTVP